MKKKTIKLICFFASLILGIILLILGNKNKYCLSFGTMLIGVSFVTFAFFKDEVFKQDLEKFNNEIESEEYEIDENEYKKITKKAKRKKNFAFCMFLLAGAVLFFAGIITLF